jgi:hypothetical protein
MISSKTLRLGLFGLLVLALAACDDGETTDLSTTSSLVSSPTTGGGGDATTTTVGTEGDTTSTTLVGQQVAEYEVVARVSDPAGETLFIVIPPGAYTDVDLENFVVGLVDSGEITYGAEIFDDNGAVDAYRKPEAERTEGETQLIEQHHFASVQNGTTVVYRGPFADSGEFVIGS